MITCRQHPFMETIQRSCYFWTCLDVGLGWSFLAFYLFTYLFILSLQTHSLLVPYPLCCSTLCSCFSLNYLVFLYTACSIYYHWSILRLSYYTNMDQVCGWWETFLAAHSDFFHRLFRRTILWGTVSILCDRKGYIYYVAANRSNLEYCLCCMTWTILIETFYVW